MCAKLVLAMNAWSAAIPELAPALFVISSDDAVSAPMPERLRQAGYERGPLMIDSRVFVSGWRPTRDGRLVVGVTGGHIGFGGRIDGGSIVPRHVSRTCGRACGPVIPPCRVPS